MTSGRPLRVHEGPQGWEESPVLPVEIHVNSDSLFKSPTRLVSCLFDRNGPESFDRKGTDSHPYMAPSHGPFFLLTYVS